MQLAPQASGRRLVSPPAGFSLLLLLLLLAGVEHWNKDAPGSPHYVPVLFATYVVGLMVAYMAGATHVGWVTTTAAEQHWLLALLHDEGNGVALQSRLTSVRTNYKFSLNDVPT
jgi:hypothetical protein